MANVTESEYISVEQWNDEFSSKLIGDSVILVIYMIIGLIGNSIVIYIHIWALKGNFEDRYFIPSLAIVDLLSCVTNSCFSFSINLLPVNYTNDTACKIMWFICMSFTAASAFMLLVISVQRYQKICKPFGPQMNLMWKRIALFLVGLASVLLSFPCFFFYGSKDVVHKNNVTIGKRCTNIRGPWSKTEALVFKGAIMIVVVGVLIVLTVMYVLIGRVIYQQIRFRKKGNYLPSASSDDHSQSRTQETSCSESKVGHSEKMNGASETTPGKDSGKINGAIEAQLDSDTEKSGKLNGVIDALHDNEKVQFKTTNGLIEADSSNGKVTFSEDSGSKEHSKTTPTKATKSKKSANKTLHGLRLSFIFMVITIIFILAFIPKVGMMIWESRHENFWTNLSHSEMGGYRFLYTMFIINNIINPFIYGFFDRRFRKQLKKSFSFCNKRSCKKVFRG